MGKMYGVHDRFDAQRSGLRKTSLLVPILTLYIVLLIVISSIACLYGYRQKSDELHAQINLIMSGLSREYQDIVSNFWQIYIPIFDRNNTLYDVLVNYFVHSMDRTLIPAEKGDLIHALSQMMLRDDRIEWIMVYSEDRKANYILYHDNTMLYKVPEDFPYLKKLRNRNTVMEIFGMESLQDYGINNDTFAICGGVPKAMGNGCIMAGYKVSSLESISAGYHSLIDSLKYYMLTDDVLVYTSDHNYDESPPFIPTSPFEGTIVSDKVDGQRMYVKARICATNTSYLVCTASWWEIFRYSHGNTLFLLLIVLAFTALSIMGYALMQHYITREVNLIRKGLLHIGNNHLDYRLPTSFRQNGLSDIAISVNDMAHRLNENIKRVYYYQIKQKDAELAELQAKFNPHFLYNTLEMLRARCCQSGDDETADLITQLAAIFRGFIGSRTFVPLKEELTSCRHYLALLGARYDGSVNIRFDFETDILYYGVIRNIFQPLIENYFVHGFDATEANNYILLHGKSLDDRFMQISVEDNGTGMDDRSIKELNARMREPIEESEESYGLKNLHQRLNLFYGGDCGLSVTRNGEKGLCVRMVLLKMTCDEYYHEKDSHP